MYPTLKKIISGILISSLVLFSYSYAQTPKEKADPVVESLLRKAKDKFGAENVKSVTKTEVPNLYEIVIGTDIVYSTQDFSYLINGMIVENTTGKNITRERIEKLSSIPFNELPLQQAIKVVRGNGKRTMAVFEDPYCGFCRRFEQETLSTLNNVTIYYFMFPILREDSAEKAKNILCSDNPAKTREEWFIENKTPPTAKDTCKVKTDELVSLGQKLRVSGTPTSFLENGQRVSGAIPKTALETQLGEAK